MRVTRVYWPLASAAAVFCITVTCLATISIARNDGRLIYALDDAYIHMAIAENFAEHGVWGVTRHAFSSCSSSPLWTLLLASVGVILGVHETTPFVLNILFALVLLFVLDSILRRQGFRPMGAFIVLLAVAFLAPLTSLTFCGLEHTLHILLVIPLVYLTVQVLLQTNGRETRSVWLGALAMLAIMTRYETMFLLSALCGLCVLKRKWWLAALLLAGGCLPIVVYGIISVGHGWYFFPNSVLLKGHTPVSSYLKIAFAVSREFMRVGTVHLLSMMALAAFILIRYVRQRPPFRSESGLLMALFIATTILHLQFARAGYFFRYDAYLVVLGLWAITLGGRERSLLSVRSPGPRTWTPATLTGIALTVCLLIPVAGRGFVALQHTPRATSNIYQQQYQMGLFLKEYYQDSVVALNDIGAVNALADVSCVDLYGLGTLKVAQLKLANTYDTEAVDRITTEAGVRVAIVYDAWYQPFGGLPPTWVKCGEWRIRNRIVCDKDTVALYAVAPEEVDHLLENLRAFSTSLPPEVIQQGRYVEHAPRSQRDRTSRPR